MHIVKLLETWLIELEGDNMDNDLPQREICALQVLNLVSSLYDILKLSWEC